MTHPAGSRLALFGALAVTFDLMHDALDQWAQSDFQAVCKDYYGRDPVGHSPAGQARWPVRTDRWCRPQSATALGRQAATCHVAVYTAGQLAGAITVTRTLGLPTPWRAVAAGALVNATTHWIIDRRRPLLAAARLAGKSDYISAATVVRGPDRPAASTGPGTALFELDRSAHRLIGFGAALLTTWLATRTSSQKEATS